MKLNDREKILQHLVVERFISRTNIHIPTAHHYKKRKKYEDYEGVCKAFGDLPPQFLL